MEFKRIKDYIKNDTLSPAVRRLSVISRLAYMFYWMFDTMATLIKHNLITPRIKVEVARKLGYQFWMMGILMTIALTLIKMAETA